MMTQAAIQQPTLEKQPHDATEATSVPSQQPLTQVSEGHPAKYVVIAGLILSYSS